MSTKLQDAARAALSDETILALRSKHGWAKETIRAIESEVLAALAADEAREPVVSVNVLADMAQSLNGLDRGQQGYHERKGWNAALRRAMDYARPPAPAAQAEQPAQGLADESSYTPTDMRDGLEAIRRYGLDTLSGRTDGPADAQWYRAAVNEMTRRARLALASAPRVPLTDEQIKAAVGASPAFWATSALWIKSVAHAVERAHGITQPKEGA